MRERKKKTVGVTVNRDKYDNLILEVTGDAVDGVKAEELVRFSDAAVRTYWFRRRIFIEQDTRRKSHDTPAPTHANIWPRAQTASGRLPTSGRPVQMTPDCGSTTRTDPTPIVLGEIRAEEKGPAPHRKPPADGYLEALW